MDSDRHSQYEEALGAVKQHLEQMEELLNAESNGITSFDEQRHFEQKPLLDQVLKSGHLLIDALENGRALSLESQTSVKQQLRLMIFFSCL